MPLYTNKENSFEKRKFLTCNNIYYPSGGDLPDPPDPYVKVYLMPGKKKKKKTDVVKDSGNPRSVLHIAFFMAFCTYLQSENCKGTTFFFGTNLDTLDEVKIYLVVYYLVKSPLHTFDNSYLQ